MFFHKVIILLFIVQSIAQQTYGQRQKKFFRYDYNFLEETQSFYKIHTIYKSWQDAKKTCALEGSTLFYPEDKAEWDAVSIYWQSKQPVGWIFIGVSSLLAKGVFVTVDGISIAEVYHNWSPGEPNDAGGEEDCVTIEKTTGGMNDNGCWKKHPFMCKKTLASLEWNEQCDMPNKDYVYNEALRTCYKVHLTPKNWTEAYTICSSEQSHLAVIDSQAEADNLVAMIENAPKDKIKGKYLSGVVLLGFHNRHDEEWTTIMGTSVDDSGYSVWGNHQLDDNDQDQCGSMFFNGRLHAVGCGHKCIFICEHKTDSGGRNSFFRRDYDFLKKTQSFYKIHTIHRTWLEAKRTCALEGAALFYPEDNTELNAVSKYWQGEQPFDWIYIGVSSLLAKGAFETIDGISILEVYYNWLPAEPNNQGGVEDCVIMQRYSGLMNDDDCKKKYPFMCKKTLATLDWNVQCDMPYKDYVLNEVLGRCYKLHLTPMNWVEAYRVCSAEQSYLAVINSKAEADYLVNITEQAPKVKVKRNYLAGSVLLGFHNIFNDGWTTIKGIPLEDSEYSLWGKQHPDEGDKKQCGAMFYNGYLNDVRCGDEYFFICEHEVKSDDDENFG